MKQLSENKTKLSDPICGLLFSLIVLTFGSETASAAPSPETIKGNGMIAYVTDGDTARVHLPEAVVAQAKKAARIAERRYQRDMDLERIYEKDNMLIRVANIDTAESVHKDASRNTKAGKVASDFANTMFAADRVRAICYEVGYYGRPICDIRSNDGDWAEIMIRAGYTKYITKWGLHPDSSRHRSLSQSQAETFSN